MKKTSILSVLCGLFLAGTAGAANVTLYHSPSCPHCHHARDFIAGALVYEYPTISVEAVNVTDGGDNFKSFEAALKKCEFTSGGIPLIVIGDKCFQGYAPQMDQELRDATSIGLSESDKAKAIENRKAMEKDSVKFKSQNANRDNIIVERGAVVETQKKTEKGSSIYFYGILIALVAGLGFVLIRKKK